jgi:hypothetical protein
LKLDIYRDYKPSANWRGEGKMCDVESSSNQVMPGGDEIPHVQSSEWRNPIYLNKYLVDIGFIVNNVSSICVNFSGLLTLLIIRN